MRRLLFSSIPSATVLYIFAVNIVMAAPPNPQDISNRSCSGATSWEDAIMRAIAPWIGAAILLSIAGVTFAGDRMNGLLHQTMSIVGQHAMSFIMAASAATLGGLIVVAAGLQACP